MFKVGDKVRIKSTTFAALCGFEIGDIATIVGIDKNESTVLPYRVTKDGYNGYVGEEHIELVQDTVTLVAGRINATGKILYWKTNIETNIGDYAVVQNASGYDLIKVVGIVYTPKNATGNFSNTKYENMKEIIKIVNFKEEK